MKKPLFVFLFLLPVLAVSQDNVYVAPDVNIISVTPVQGSGLSIDRVPGKIQTLSRDKIDKKKNFSITETLNRETTGISLFNLNSSPMQNDINYRGEMVNGVPNGTGILNHQNKRNYSGQIKEGEYDGYGTLILFGKKYTGTWREGEPWNIIMYDEQNLEIKRWFEGKEQ